MNRKAKKAYTKVVKQMQSQPVAKKEGVIDMRNQISPELVQTIKERPAFLDSLGTGFGGKAMAYSKIAETLNLIERNKCITWDKEEYIKEFGKNGKASMVAAMKKRGIRKPRCVIDDGTKTVYLWKLDN